MKENQMKIWKEVASVLLAVPMLVSGAASASAGQPQQVTPRPLDETEMSTAGLTLTSSYDFTDATGSTTVPDKTGSYDMTLHNGASVGAFGDRDGNEALNLDNKSDGDGKYASLPSTLFQNLGDKATIDFAAKSRHNDDGNYFTFAVGPNQNKYLFFYLSTKNAKLVISNNKWSNEQGFKDNLDNNNGVWHNFRIVVDGTTLALFRDGSLVDIRENTGIKLSDLGGYNTNIGKSFYDGDKYWNGAMDDLKIYKGANLTFPTSVDVTGDGVSSGALTLTEGQNAVLSATVSPNDAISKDVVWTSSDSSVASVDGTGKVTAVKNGTATITAASKMRDSVRGAVAVTVKALDPAQAAKEDVDAAVAALKTSTTENLPLSVKGSKHDSDITWTSAAPKVITGTKADYQAPSVGAADPYRGGGVVTRPAYGAGDSKPVKLTATATKSGQTATASVDVKVKEKTRVAPNTGYAAVTFLSDADTTNGKIGEALYESATSTTENNFFSFSEINGGNPVITSHTDTTGLRDPYVLRSHDGDKYYMIATDLKVSQQGWGQNQQYGSLKVEVWESTDMVNWTRTNAEDGTDSGIVVNSSNQGMTWAPEAFWDDSLGSYVVFFSSRAYTDDSRTTAKTGNKGGAYNIVRYVTTRDFKTFTPAKDWQDTGYSRIDSSVFKIGDYYYRMTKNEEGGAAGDYITTGKSTFLERSKCLTAKTVSADPNADENTTWRLLDQNFLPFEGPESIKLNKGDVNQNDKGNAMVVMADSGGYQPFMTSESAIVSSNWSNRLSQSAGWTSTKPAGPNVTGRVDNTGMPTPTRHGAFVSVPQQVLEAMHSYTTANPTTVKPVGSKINANYDGKTREAIAKVVADDNGSVAGTVTFAVSAAEARSSTRAGSWSQTSPLDADGTVSVVIPDDVSGDIAVTYDGYGDGLVKSASTRITGVQENQSGESGEGTNPSEGNHQPGGSANQPGGANGAHNNGKVQASSQSLSTTGSSVAAIAVLGLLALIGAVGFALFSRKEA